MSTFLMVVLVLWVVVAFFWHSVIHEGAHAFAALVHGGKDIKIYPWPGKRDGRFCFAYMEFYHYGELSRKAESDILLAPLLLESIYCGLVIAALLVFQPAGFWFWFLVIDAVSSIADMMTWCLGAWTHRRLSDGEKFRELHGNWVKCVIALPALMLMALRVLLMVV